MMYKKDIHWWLNDNYIGKEAIRFSDRIEYKRNGILHNLTGAAIKYVKESVDDLYYINGIKHTYDEWNFKMRKKKLQKLMSKSKVEI